MLISNDQAGEFLFTGDIPAELTRYHLPGSQVSACNNEYGKLLVQKIPSSPCKIFHAVYQSHKKGDLHIREKDPFFLICIALQQDIHLTIDGLEKIHIREGQFNMYYSPHFDLTSSHEEGKLYITIGLNYLPGTLREMASYFPLLLHFLEKATAGQPISLLGQPGWLTKEMQETIHRMMHCLPHSPSYSIYFELLGKTFLFHLLAQSVEERPASTYTHNDISSIYTAEDIISKNIRYHYPIRYLAQKVGINEQKLKNKFKEFFGNGVYEHLRIKRMEQARILLGDSDKSVKEIAALTGYKSVTSFIKAFKRTYQLTPGEFRKFA